MVVAASPRSVPVGCPGWVYGRRARVDVGEEELYFDFEIDLEMAIGFGLEVEVDVDVGIEVGFEEVEE